MCKTGRNRGRGPFLHCCGGRTSTTRKHLGSRAEQIRTKRTLESKRRPRGGQEILSTALSRIWPSLPQTSSSRTSSIATRPTICLARRRFGARGLEDRLEVVRHSANAKLFFTQEGNRLRGGSLLHGHGHQSGVSFFYTHQGLSLIGDGDHRVGDGECTHCTEPARISTRI